MFVAVAEAVSDNADFAAIGVHSGREAAHPHIPIGALSASNGLGVDHRFFAPAVGTADKILIAIPGLQVSPTVALVEIPLPIRSSHDSVQTVIVIPAVESAEDVLPFVYLRVELQVTIDISINNKVGRLRHHDLIAEHADPKGSNQFGILHKNV